MLTILPRARQPLLLLVPFILLFLSIFTQQSLATATIDPASSLSPDTSAALLPAPAPPTSSPPTASPSPHIQQNQQQQQKQQQQQHLNITATTSHHGSSTFECWQVQAALAPTNRSGIAGALLTNLGNVTDFLYQVLPAGFAGSLHNAPDVRWVQIVSGLAVLTLPDHPGVSYYQTPGPGGLLLATDTADVSKKGHLTSFPGTTETVALSMPVADGKVPDHTVLHSGPCTGADYAGIRAAAV